MRIKSMTLTSGCMTYGDYGRETDPVAFEQALTSVGLPKAVPNQRTWLMSLKTAMQQYAPDGHLVRPLANRNNNGYTIVREERGVDENDFQRVLNANVDDHGVVTVSHYNDGGVVQKLLQQRTNHFRHTLSADAVSKVVVGIIHKSMQGLTLRDNGGLYFIPSKYAEMWKVVAAAIGKSGPGNHITITPMEINESTIISIRDKINKEIVAMCKGIAEDLDKNEYTSRGIKHRVKETRAMFDKVEMYEKMLGGTLNACRQAMGSTLEILAKQETKSTYGKHFA